MTHDHDELATRFAYIEEHKNVANDHLKHLHAAIREAGVIVAGGEMPSRDKWNGIITDCHRVIDEISRVRNRAIQGRGEASQPTHEDIEHDIAEQRWEEERDLSAVHE